MKVNRTHGVNEPFMSSHSRGVCPRLASELPYKNDNAIDSFRCMAQPAVFYGLRGNRPGPTMVHAGRVE